jgi:hypothetical protein
MSAPRLARALNFARRARNDARFLGGRLADALRPGCGARRSAVYGMRAMGAPQPVRRDGLGDSPRPPGVIHKPMHRPHRRRRGVSRAVGSRPWATALDARRHPSPGRTAAPAFRGRSRSRKSQISPVYARTGLPVPSVRMQIDALHWRAQIKEYVEHDDA